MRIGDVADSDGRILRSTTQRLSPDGIARSRLIQPGTLIMSIAATVGRPVVTGFTTCIHDGFVSFEQLRGVDREFLFYLLKGLEDSWSSAGQTGSQTNVNTSIVSGRQVTLPVEEAEQRRIAVALGDVDDAISALERMISKKQAVKQGMMQQLLTGRTRLPGFSGEWTTRRIGDFTEVRAGGTPSTAVSRYWGGNVRWMSSGEIHAKRVSEVQGRITADGLRESAAQILPPGTVLMALAGQGKTRGTVAISLVALSTNQSIAGILPGIEHDPTFLYYNLDTRYDELRGESSGDGGRGGLNLTIIKKLAVFMPGRDEQAAIATVLADVDDEIDALNLRLAKARAVRQGVMQELLTGRTRLPMEEVA